MPRRLILLFAIFVLAAVAWFDASVEDRQPAGVQWAQTKDKSKDSKGCAKGKTFDTRSKSCI